MCTKRKTIEQVKQDVLEKYNGDIIVLSDTYINNKTKLQVLCTKCNEERPVSFNKLMTDSKCPTCSGKKRYTLDEVKQRIYDAVGNEYEILEYSGKINSTCTMLHNKCKQKFNPYLNRFLDKKRPTRCPYCSEVRNTKKTQEEFIKEMKVKFPDFEVVGKYINNMTEVEVKCKRCNKIQKKIPNWIYGNNALNCPNCDTHLMSSGVKKVIHYLNENGLKYHTEVSFKNFKSEKNRKFSYDIFIPKYGLFIEFDGSQHFIPTKLYDLDYVKKRRKYDIQKDNKILLSKKYSLLRISWKEYDNIDEIMFSILSGSSTTISKYNLLYISKNSENNYNLENYYNKRSTEMIYI